jgi:hypothetical protein
MEWWLEFIIMWLCLDLIILMVIWSGIRVIKPRYPYWWKRVIADDDPNCSDFR